MGEKVGWLDYCAWICFAGIRGCSYTTSFQGGREGYLSQMTTIIHIPQTLKRQHEDGREYKSPFLRQRRLWTTPLLEKNPAHQTQYFKVEIVKNQVQIDRRLCWL